MVVINYHVVTNQLHERDMNDTITLTREAYEKLLSGVKIPNARDRMPEINHMLELGYSRSQIARQIGCSRERLRQILGNGDDTARRRELYLAAHPDITNGQAAEMWNLSNTGLVSRYRNGNRHAVCGGVVEVGYQWEEWVIEQLIEQGFLAEGQAFGSRFDILVNGTIRVDVKVSTRPRSALSLQNISPSWNFNVGTKKKRSETDFFALVIAPSKEVFIVPESIIKNSQVNIVFCWPTLRPELSKWQQYLDRWDLLTEYLDRHEAESETK